MSERKAIEQVLRTYFESMHESNRDKVLATFHPKARIVGFSKDKLIDWSVDDFAGVVAGVQPSDAAKGKPERLEVLAIESAGATAVARLRGDFAGTTYLDTLSLLRVDGQWRIFNKLFHIEGKAA